MEGGQMNSGLKLTLIGLSAKTDARKPSTFILYGVKFDGRLIKKFIATLPKDFEVETAPNSLVFTWKNGQATINDLKTAEKLAEEEKKKVTIFDGSKWGRK
jgi:hypothetical protein